jgi:beta-lactamase class A
VLVHGFSQHYSLFVIHYSLFTTCHLSLILIVFRHRKFKRKIAMKKSLLAQMLISLVVLLSVFSSVLAQVPVVTTSSPKGDAALGRLEREMARLSKNSGGVVGATAIHIESGRRVSLNGGERFPMASSYKVPIAVQLLTRVDKGEIKLDQMIDIKQSDLHPGSGTLADLFNKPGVALSVRNLLELMLLISDNSATDVCLRVAGGADAVTARMRSLGIEGINVSGSTAEMIAAWVGVQLPPEDQLTPQTFDNLYAATTKTSRDEAEKKFNVSPRDTSTPDGMADLLAKIHRKELHKAETAELLLDIMRRCRTGEARLKGVLPANTVVAHKTGTIGGTTNDVGIITLPDNAGHVAIAVFVKASEKEVPARERVIAEIARAAHDFFLFNPK